MIKGYCRTNLDDCRRCQWPQVFAEIPIKGHMIRSADGMSELKVVGITHTTLENKVLGIDEPYIIVELNK